MQVPKNISSVLLQPLSHKLELLLLLAHKREILTFPKLIKKFFTKKNIKGLFTISKKFIATKQVKQAEAKSKKGCNTFKNVYV